MQAVMNSKNPYDDFVDRLAILIKKSPLLITTTLSNIFTMRLIGNKTHGDLAEIAVSEFINQYMYDFRSVHVGKDLFRAKSKEEDIKIINELTNDEFPVSLKAYGHGPLQLSTDKEFRMYPRLQREGSEIKGRAVRRVLGSAAFSGFKQVNVLPLIYDEKRKRCNILVFDYGRAIQRTSLIARQAAAQGRKHPVYRFYDKAQGYICEVRYGDAAANALQRGLWTHTRKGEAYFRSITNGWIDYSTNDTLVKLFSHGLVASERGHLAALEAVRTDIDCLKRDLGNTA